MTLAALAGPGCKPAKSPASPRQSAPLGPPLQFEYTTIDGKPLGTKTLAGRVSVIGFVTTYDVASQAQVRFLGQIARRHVPRLNVAVLVLEPPENQMLVEAYVATLGLPFAVALADEDTIAGRGPFAGLHHVPAVVVLDPQGREAWRHAGLVESADIEAAVRDVERRGR